MAIFDPEYFVVNKTCKVWIKLTSISKCHKTKDSSRNFRKPGSTSLLFSGYRNCLDNHCNFFLYTTKTIIPLSLWSLYQWRLFEFEDHLTMVLVICLMYSADYGLERSCQEQHSNTWRYWFYTSSVILHHVLIVSGNLCNFCTDINCD